MNPYVWLFSAWGLVTVVLIVLLIYRSRLESQETDWIPMTEDAREEEAIKTQTMIEMKTQKLIWPIRALGILSVILIVVIFGFWLYRGIIGPPLEP